MSPYAWNDKGETFFKMGQFKAAIECYNKAIDNYNKIPELDPQYIFAYYGKGRALSSLGYYREAIEHFDISLKLNPGLTSAITYKESAIKELEETEGKGSRGFFSRFKGNQKKKIKYYTSDGKPVYE